MRLSLLPALGMAVALSGCVMAVPANPSTAAYASGAGGAGAFADGPQ